MKIKSLTLMAFVALFSVGVAAADRVVHVYNWSDYIAEDTLEKFTAQTGIEVVYDVFDSNEILEAKLLAGQSGYDVVVPTSDFLARHIQAGIYQPLDKSKLPNWQNLDTDLLNTLSTHDAGNAYGVPYQWGTTGLGYNVAKVKEILGDDAPTDSWSLLFDPSYASKLAECGITVLDSANEVLPFALNYLGLDPNSKNTKDYKQAEALLLAIRPHINYFHSSQYIGDLANGDVCLSMGWSGDIFQAMTRAEEADNGIEIAYTIPKEGAGMWADMMAIPKDAPNLDAAYEFINFVLDAQIGADITNYVWYGSPNKAARAFIDDEILSDPAIYPPEGAKLFSLEMMPMKITRTMTRTWSKVKSGR
ncbi:MAG: putrescine-binding protein SpuD [Candidatus Pelagadaptatus aseana]|uniref:polyamine ABC transporter substrate-binding protein n=1 Tax=Candidatus Pelagadaptatus aseana TaxID=3120508 RepID=UPI0039B292E0